jgi:predicted deacylase
MTLVIRARQPKGGDHVEVLLYACHLLLPTCPHAMSPFMSVTYVSPHPGSKLIVLGAVHGNEICGTLAIRRVIDELDRGALALVSGQLTLVPVTNPLAYKNRRRNGERNLNRNLAPSSVPRDYEDHIANWLCPLLARHEVLLDLHSFQAPGAAFVMLGPENNQGPIEPFSQAAEEEALALRLGVGRALCGWLSCYAAGAARRDGAPAASSVAQGTGTTEYMRSVGGWALTLECGQHDDPDAPHVAYRAIVNTLAQLQLIDAPRPEEAPRMEGLRLCEVIDKAHASDTFASDWKSFDPVSAGQLIGKRHDGTPVFAPFEGRVVFPKGNADAGEEWFYLAKAHSRLNRG